MEALADTEVAITDNECIKSTCCTTQPYARFYIKSTLMKKCFLNECMNLSQFPAFLNFSSLSVK